MVASGTRVGLGVPLRVRMLGMCSYTLGRWVGGYLGRVGRNGGGAGGEITPGGFGGKEGGAGLDGLGGGLG